MAQVAFNPLLTTTAPGSFQVESTGYVQGVAMDDPSARYRLAGGILADTEVLPMWGGVGIFDNVTPTPGGPSAALGGLVGRATQIQGAAPADGDLVGFSVFDQDHAMFTTPQSPVPLQGSRGQVNFYKFGSQARIALAADPALATLEGHIITARVSWDFVNQRLVPFAPAYAAIPIIGAVWAGGIVTFQTGARAPDPLAPGVDITITGMNPAGYNGSFSIIAVPDNAHFTVAIAANPGAFVAGGAISAGGGAVPCKVLDFQATGNMTVSFDPVTGFATWNRNGACALIQI